MLKKLRQTIKSKRNSKNTFWTSFFLIKDFLRFSFKEFNVFIYTICFTIFVIARTKLSPKRDAIFQDYSIWVLSLKKSKLRRNFMESQLKYLGTDYKIVEAIDGKKISREDLEHYFSKEEGYELLSGERGCALSHRRLWEQIVAGSHNEVLILEDDVILNKNIFSLIQKKEFLPDDWEFINFSTDAKQETFGEYLFKNYKVSMLSQPAWSAACYLINKKGAKKLLNSSFPIRYQADVLTTRTDITNLVSYGIKPDIVKILKFSSTIQCSKRWYSKII